MIGIKGQYLFDIQLGNAKNFLREEDLISFKIVEEAGNECPMFEMVFRLRDPALLQALNQSNQVKISLGVDQSKMLTSQFRILDRARIPESSQSTLVRITGILDILTYFTNASCQINGKTTLSIIKEIAGKYFNALDIDVEPGEDEMNWINHFRSDAAFINRLWLHSDSGDDLPLLGLTTLGEFRYKSLAKLLKRNPSCIFVSMPDGRNPCMSQLPIISTNFSDVATVSGHSKSSLVTDFNSKDTKLVTANEGVFVSNTEGIGKVNPGKIIGTANYFNENVYPGYHANYQSNVKALVSLNTVSAKCIFPRQLFEIKVLDIVWLKDSTFGTRHSIEDTSGAWIVKRVARVIEQGMLTTTVLLTRDYTNKLLKV